MSPTRLGSSISNVLVILGLTCVLSGSAVSVSDDVLWLDLPLAALEQLRISNGDACLIGNRLQKLHIALAVSLHPLKITQRQDNRLTFA